MPKNPPYRNLLLLLLSCSPLLQTMNDLLDVGCEVLTIGQYLQPTLEHMPVKEYIHPDIFEYYRNEALRRGFSQVESSPLVRSSYHAEKHASIKKKSGIESHE